MTDQETVMLIETEQRCKSNTHRLIIWKMS